MKYRSVVTSEIKVGDVVLNHGMKVRIDKIEEIEDSSTYGGRFHCCLGTVLNLDEVAEAQVVPLGWLTTEKYDPAEGWTIDRNDFWNVQGNDLATWAILDEEN